MRVKLIDIDNKYRERTKRGLRWQNLALMKISAWYKELGYEVGFNIENPNLTVISCVFTKHRLNAIWECLNTNQNARWFGGSGLNMAETMPDLMDHIKPDYDLYPIDGYHQHSLGFTSRGCPNRCGFCIVHDKEGDYRRVQHVKEFVDFRYKDVTLFDNNILADPEWFFENTNWIIDNKLKLNISQGMDIRLLTDEISEQLRRIKFVKGQMRFAWDNVALEPIVKSGIEMLKDHKINTKRNVQFFVLSGWNNVPFCKDVYRCNKLKEFGALPYVMPYDGGTPLIQALARWANRVRPFKKGPFYQYERMPKSIAESISTGEREEKRA